MPREGFKTITVSEELYEKLKQCADERFTTVPKIILYLIDFCNKEVIVKEAV